VREKTRGILSRGRYTASAASDCATRIRQGLRSSGEPDARCYTFSTHCSNIPILLRTNPSSMIYRLCSRGDNDYSAVAAAHGFRCSLLSSSTLPGLQALTVVLSRAKRVVIHLLSCRPTLLLFASIYRSPWFSTFRDGDSFARSTASIYTAEWSAFSCTKDVEVART
jgi:hypothetical protein